MRVGERIGVGERIVRVDSVLRLGLLVCVASSLLGSAVSADELKRGGMLGVQLAPLSDEEAQAANPGGGGLKVSVAMPGMAAQAAGVQANDIIIKVDGKRVTGFEQGRQLLGGHHAGEEIALTIRRGDKMVEIRFALGERPRESSEEFEVIYDAAGPSGRRARTLVTRPKGAGRFPAVLVIQSLQPMSMEFSHPMMARHPYKQLVDRLTRAGFVTMRVERLGTGDSEGGNDPRDAKLRDDLMIFTAALTRLHQYDFVDPQRVFVFGSSVGTVITPQVARAGGARGIMTYAAVAGPWMEHHLAAARRQWELDMLEAEEIARREGHLRQFVQACLLDGVAPADVLAEHPELRPATEGMLQDDLYVFGSHYSFFQDLARVNLLAAWEATDVPVLALWGACDYVAGRACSESLVQAVNRKHPGAATFVVLPGTDHNFDKAEDMEESYLAGFSGQFNPLVVQKMVAWMKQVPPRASTRGG